MARVAHPRNYSAQLLPPPRLGNQALRDGTAWIEKQKALLAAGELPEPTPSTAQRLTLRYKITDGDSQEHFIELLDYSGELMQAEKADANLAENLRKVLVEMDGLLIVAEHPRPGMKANEKAQELHSLMSAFAKLREDQTLTKANYTVPMALLVNKWDRAGTICRGKESEIIEHQKLETFLNSDPPPPHKRLFYELLPASGRNCTSFPVSAFGEATFHVDPSTGIIIEKPKDTTELQAFGLEEPFLWLVEKRDSLDLEQLEKRINTSALLTIRPILTERLKEKAAKLHARMSPGAPSFAHAVALHRKLSNVQLWQTVSFVIFLFLSALGGEAAFDALGHREARQAIYNVADAQAWRKASLWYRNFALAKPWRHQIYGRFFLTRDDAGSERNDALKKEDEESWKTVTNAIELGDKKERADTYLSTHNDELHLCAHKQECDDIIAKWTFEQSLKTVGESVEIAKGKFKGLESRFVDMQKNSQSDYKAILADLQKLDSDLHQVQNQVLALTNDNLVSEYKSVLGDIQKLEQTVIPLIEHRELIVEYLQEMSGRDVTSAGRRLLTKMSSEDFKEQHLDFSKRALDILEANVAEKSKSGAEWKSGLAALKEFSSVGDIMSLLPKDTGDRLGLLQSAVMDEGDHYYYNRILNNHDDITAVDFYLANFSGPHVQKVQSLKDYLSKKATMQHFRISVSSVDFAAVISSWAVDVVGEITLKTDSDSTVATLPQCHGGLLPLSVYNRVTADLKCRAIDPSSISVKLLSKHYGTYDLGGGLVSSPIAKWPRGGISMTLSGGSYPGTEVSIIAQISDGRGGWVEFVKPSLGPWSSRK